MIIYIGEESGCHAVPELSRAIVDATSVVERIAIMFIPPMFMPFIGIVLSPIFVASSLICVDEPSIFMSEPPIREDEPPIFMDEPSIFIPSPFIGAGVGVAGLTAGVARLGAGVAGLDAGGAGLGAGFPGLAAGALCLAGAAGLLVESAAGMGIPPVFMPSICAYAGATSADAIRPERAEKTILDFILEKDGFLTVHEMSAHPTGERDDDHSQRIDECKRSPFPRIPTTKARDAPQRQRAKHRQSRVAKVLMPLDFLGDFVCFASVGVAVKAQPERDQKQRHARQLHPKRAVAPSRSFGGKKQRRQIEINGAQQQTDGQVR